MKYEGLNQCLEVLKAREEVQSDLVVRPKEIEMDTEAQLHIALSPTPIPMTKWAHGQLAAKLEIPNGYYNRMLENDKHLLSKNVNKWLPEVKDILIRTEAGNARAILSSRYKMVQNRLVLLTVMNALQDMHRPYLIRSLVESDTTFYAKFVGTETYNIGNNDLYRGGIVLRNSEIGASRLKVDLFVSRLSCGNDAIFGDDGISRIHIGRKLEAGIVNFQQDTIAADTDAMMKAIRDVTQTAFDPAGIQHIYDTIKLGKENVLEKASQVVRAIQTQNKFSDELTDRLLMSMHNNTQYDIAQAITFNAQAFTDEDRRIEMEELGGAILIMPKDEFNSTYKPKEDSSPSSQMSLFKEE